jgi:hypothetical protein
MAKPKARPQPLDEADSLEQRLERAARDEVDRELRVYLVVAGGAPSQRYRFHFAADGGGRLRCELDCELSERRGKASRQGRQKEFADLVRAIVASGVLKVAPEEPRFLPDTVVGTLELSDGRSSLRWDFAADPEQAKTQDAVPPPALARAADEVYSLGARLMDKRTPAVKP